MPKLFDWEKLQEDVCILLTAIDGHARVSKGSGAVKGNGDVVSNSYMAECKLRSTDGFTIDPKVYTKISKEAALLGRVPLLVNRNKKGVTLVTMALEDFHRVAGLPADKKDCRCGNYCP